MNRRRSHLKIKSIFECVSIGEDEILLREVFENEVLERFADHDTMNVPRILVKQLLNEVSEEEAVKLIEEMAKSV